LPQFQPAEQNVNQDGQELTEVKLTGKPLSYSARGQRPEDAEAAKAYRQFADWCARLNATRPGNLPPGARLALNAALAERELVPLEISRTIPPARPLAKALETRSQHRFNWTLSGEDRKKIDRAADMMARFQLVSYDEYRRSPEKTAKQPARQASSK
jgi:hypothetical protein